MKTGTQSTKMTTKKLLIKTSNNFTSQDTCSSFTKNLSKKSVHMKKKARSIKITRMKRQRMSKSSSTRKMTTIRKSTNNKNNICWLHILKRWSNHRWIIPAASKKTKMNSLAGSATLRDLLGDKSFRCNPTRKAMKRPKTSKRTDSSRIQVRKTCDQIKVIIAMLLKTANTNLKMAPFIKDNGLEGLDMGLALRLGLMGLSIKESGKTTKRMEEASFIMLMVMSLTVSGKMIKQMALESTTIQMGRSMKVNGWTTSKKAREKKPGRMDLTMRVTTNKGKSMALVVTFGTTAPPTRGSGSIIRLRGKVAILGRMAESMKDNGRKIRCMDTDVSFGQMVALTKENSKTMSRMGKALISGLTVKSTQVNGWTASSTAKACIQL